MNRKAGWPARLSLEGVAALRKQSRLELARRALERVLPALGKDREISLYGFAQQPLSLESDDLASVEPKGTATAIGDALAGALAEHRGQPLAGVLLVSDGQSNAGEDARKVAEQAGKQGVPIVALAVGTEEGPSNARLAAIEADPGRVRARPNGSRGAGRSPRHARTHRRGHAREAHRCRLERSRPRGDHLRRRHRVAAGEFQDHARRDRRDRVSRPGLRAGHRIDRRRQLCHALDESRAAADSRAAGRRRAVARSAVLAQCAAARHGPGIRLLAANGRRRLRTSRHAADPPVARATGRSSNNTTS